LRDLLRRHRGEGGVGGRGARCGHRDHQVRVSRVLLRCDVRVSSDGVHRVHGQSVAVVLKPEMALLRPRKGIAAVKWLDETYNLSTVRVEALCYKAESRGFDSL
jgi:hypothetical protein